MVQPHSPHFDYQALASLLGAAAGDSDLFQAIADAPFASPVPAALIFLGIVVLLQVNPAAKMIERVALSQTEMARMTTDVTAVPFHDIKIPLNHYDNIIAHAIASGEPSDTTDWRFLFEPAMTPEQARINQANAGIAYSAVYPLAARSGGALIFSYFQYQHKIGEQQLEFMQKYSLLADRALS